MKSATAAIAVPIQISVQRSLLAAEVVVAVGDTATSASVGTALVGTLAASVPTPTSVTVARAAVSDFDIRNRIVNGPLDAGRGSVVTESTDAVSFCCGRVSERDLHFWSLFARPTIVYGSVGRLGETASSQVVVSMKAEFGDCRSW